MKFGIKRNGQPKMRIWRQAARFIAESKRRMAELRTQPLAHRAGRSRASRGNRGGISCEVIWAEVRPGSGSWVLALTAQDGLEDRDRDELLAVYPWIAPMIARDVSAHQSGNH